MAEPSACANGGQPEARRAYVAGIIAPLFGLLKLYALVGSPKGFPPDVL